MTGRFELIGVYADGVPGVYERYDDPRLALEERDRRMDRVRAKGWQQCWMVADSEDYEGYVSWAEDVCAPEGMIVGPGGVYA